MNLKKIHILLIIFVVITIFTFGVVILNAASDTTIPSAKFEISNITPSINESITFDASTSSDTEGAIASYEWDFGDNTTKATGAVVKHSYATRDDFKVTLTVKDSAGNIDTNKKKVFVGRPSGWTEKSHSKSGDPDYDLLFSDDKVSKIDISMSSSDFQKIKTDLSKLNMQSTQDPMYVPVTVKFNNKSWNNVGFRYKGHSSLFGTQNKNKLPFRLNFDKYEDTNPEISDQKFYGFSELSFGNCWNDNSFMKDKIVSDIFRAGGVPTARISAARIYIDTGSGSKYWGLYSLAEDVSDAMLKTQFEGGKGNAYKPFGTGADWSSPLKQTAFEKVSNETANDFSDIISAHSALYASKTDAAAWRANLEKSFNVTRFLRWLAINTAVVNWDSYGTMAQNYYLYQDVATDGALVWIPWDFNLAMSQSMMGGKTLSLSLSEVTDRWPVIKKIIDDPVYKNIYNYEMKKAISGCLLPDPIIAKVQKYQALIKPYVVGAEGETSDSTHLSGGESAFNNACNTIATHLRTRQTEVNTYLNSVTINPTPTVSTIPKTSTVTKSPTPTPTVSSTVLMGDVNLDGKVTSTDVSMCERYVLGSINLSQAQFTAADVNKDGKITSSDASLIGRFLLGTITSL